ncbi:MAG: hypothetical protein EOP49_17315 [Sphingobacteriales bacterium]|nr:MAG: hypothetical protein EOP49_17315 [Sphingobacteriales bacterium]
MTSKISIIISFACLALFLNACDAQSNRVVMLDNIPGNFDVAGFYKDRLQKTNKRLATDPKSVDRKDALRMLNDAFFAKDTLATFSSDGRFPDELYLDATSEWMSRKKQPVELLGYQYKTVAWDEDDTLAVLNAVAFPKLDMAEDKQGRLLYLEAEKTSKNAGDSVRIFAWLQKHCRKLSVDDSDARSSYWQNTEYYFVFTLRPRQEEEIMSFDAQGNKQARQIAVTDMSLHLYSKTYVQAMKVKGIYSAGRVFWGNAESR